MSCFVPSCVVTTLAASNCSNCSLAPTALPVLHTIPAYGKCGRQRRWWWWWWGSAGGQPGKSYFAVSAGGDAGGALSGTVGGSAVALFASASVAAAHFAATRQATDVCSAWSLTDLRSASCLQHQNIFARVSRSGT